MMSRLLSFLKVTGCCCFFIWCYWNRTDVLFVLFGSSSPRIPSVSSKFFGQKFPCRSWIFFFSFFSFFLNERIFTLTEGGLEADDPWGRGCCSSPVLRTPVNPLESDRSVSDPLDSAGLVLTFNPSGLEMDHFSVKLLLVLKLRCYREKNWNWRLLMTVPASSVCTERLSKA